MSQNKTHFITLFYFIQKIVYNFCDNAANSFLFYNYFRFKFLQKVNKTVEYDFHDVAYVIIYLLLSFTCIIHYGFDVFFLLNF